MVVAGSARVVPIRVVTCKYPGQLDVFVDLNGIKSCTSFSTKFELIFLRLLHQIINFPIQKLFKFRLYRFLLIFLLKRPFQKTKEKKNQNRYTPQMCYGPQSHTLRINFQLCKINLFKGLFVNEVFFWFWIILHNIIKVWCVFLWFGDSSGQSGSIDGDWMR